jgi:xanthine dehydrogenase accessory factor
MLDILETVESWLDEGRSIAQATVVSTWGSAPRQVGSKMAVSGDLAMIGSVSGGCVETAVIEEASEILKTKKPRLLNFGISDDTAWDVGLTCGGKISVFVEPLDPAWWRCMTDFIRQDRSAATITILSGDAAGEKIITDKMGTIYYATPALSTEQQTTLAQAAGQNQSGRANVNDLDVMVDVHRPRPHLILIGGVHVAMPLQKFAHQLGFRVSLVDPRQAFATQERFPDVGAILHSYPDKALNQLGLDEDTYVAVLTHDPKIDDPALRTALPSPAPYVGVLSSKRTHEARIERLTEAGVSPEQLARIHTPIGIDIGAKTPEEIALCIMAEIIAVRNQVQA